MGQITTNIYQKACIYDFTVDGGADSLKNLGISFVPGETITSVFYSVLVPLATASATIEAGLLGFDTAIQFVTQNVAALNAAVGGWLTPGAVGGFPFKIAVGTVGDFAFYFNPNGNPLTAGKMLFSFTVLSHPL